MTWNRMKRKLLGRLHFTFKSTWRQYRIARTNLLKRNDKEWMDFETFLKKNQILASQMIKIITCYHFLLFHIYRIQWNIKFLKKCFKLDNIYYKILGNSWRRWALDGQYSQCPMAGSIPGHLIFEFLVRLGLHMVVHGLRLSWHNWTGGVTSLELIHLSQKPRIRSADKSRIGIEVITQTLHTLFHM